MNRVEPAPISELSFEAVGIRLGERRVLDGVSFKLRVAKEKAQELKNYKTSMGKISLHIK